MEKPHDRSGLPSLESLRCFVEGARLLNFRAAARVVALTPAALGERIRGLEEQLDRPLFHRTTRRMVLTQAGLDLLPHAERALAAGRDCLRAGRGELAPAPMELTVGTRHELGLSWLMPSLPLLQAVRPQLTIHLYFGSGADLAIRVRTLEIDCAVGSMRLTDSKLEAIQLHREDYAFVGAPRLLRRLPLRRASQAERHVLIDTNPELLLYRYFRDAPGPGEGMRFGATRFLGTIAAIRLAVLGGEGVAVLPSYLVADDLAAGRLVPLFSSVKLEADWFRLLFRAGDPRRSLYESLAERLRGLPLR